MSALKSLRTSAFQAQHGRCYYCGAPMWLDDPTTFAASFGCTAGQLPSLQATAEHLVALCDGGKTTASNIVAAHQLCNGRRHKAKAPLEPDRYRERVARRVARGKWFDVQLLTLVRRSAMLRGERQCPPSARTDIDQLHNARPKPNPLRGPGELA